MLYSLKKNYASVMLQKSQAEKETLFPNSAQSANAARAQYFKDVHLAEHSVFWNRFIAFSALSASLLVSIDAILSPEWVSGAGLFLSLIWLFVQFKSRGDASQWKPSFHATRKVAGFFKNEQERIDYLDPAVDDVSADKRKRFWQFTTLDMGAIVPVAVAIFWISELIRRTS